MGKRGAGITVKVKKTFHNESYFANMSYYFCGDLVPQDEEFDICYWEKKDDIVEQIWNKLESRPDYLTKFQHTQVNKSVFSSTRMNFLFVPNLCITIQIKHLKYPQFHLHLILLHVYHLPYL